MERSIALLGDVAVGKTSLIGRMSGVGFIDVHNPTIQPSILKIKAENSQKEQIYIQIWDTAGQEIFDSIPPFCFRGLNIALICFECNSDSSRNSIYKWVQKVKDERPEAIFYLVATKCDLLENDYSEIDEILNETTNAANSPFSKCFRTSSESGEGVKELLSAIVEEKIVVVEPMKKDDIDLEGEKNGEEKKCC